MFFLAGDGRNVGKYIATPLLKNDESEVGKRSANIIEAMELMQKIALSAGCKVVFCGGDDILVSHRDRCVLVNLAPEFKDIFYDHTGSGLIFDCAFGDSLSAAHQNLNDTKGFNLNDTLKTLELLPSSLKLSRLRLGLTQQELADRLGVAYQQVQRYERTEYKNISLKRLRVIVTELIHNPEN